MQFIFDHLASLLIATTVMLIGASMLLTQSEGRQEGLNYYMLQQTRQAFTDQVEVDLMNAGVARPVGVDPILGVSAEHVEFYGVVDTLGTSGIIEYRRVLDHVADSVSYYRVERRVNGTLDGQSAATVTRFELSLLDDDDNEIIADSMLSEATAIEVDAEWALPKSSVGSGSRRQAIYRSAWKTRVYPVAF